MPAPQLVANQANAQLSTGPVTVEGKTRSARNALRHGLTAKNPLLSEEDREEYKHHCESYFARFAWREECERELIQRMADIEWRLRRIPYIESALMEAGEFAALANIAMYEQRLQRTKEKALAHLRQLQASRSKEEIKNGFVFSKPAPSKIFCGRCFTESAGNKVCEHCGSKNHLMTEEQFDFMHPMNVDSDGNVLSNDASTSATSSQLSLSFSPGDIVSATAGTTVPPPADASGLSLPDCTNIRMLTHDGSVLALNRDGHGADNTSDSSRTAR